MKIVTNNIPRPIIYGYELSEKETAEFDYLDSEEMQCRCFARYKGNLYDLGDIMAVDQFTDQFKGWHGYVSESFFSGILVRYTEDYENIVFGWYYC